MTNLSLGTGNPGGGGDDSLSRMSSAAACNTWWHFSNVAPGLFNSWAMTSGHSAIRVGPWNPTAHRQEVSAPAPPAERLRSAPRKTSSRIRPRIPWDRLVFRPPSYVFSRMFYIWKSKKKSANLSCLQLFSCYYFQDVWNSLPKKQAFIAEQVVPELFFPNHDDMAWQQTAWRCVQGRRHRSPRKGQRRSEQPWSCKNGKKIPSTICFDKENCCCHDFRNVRNMGCHFLCCFENGKSSWMFTGFCVLKIELHF